MSLVLKGTGLTVADVVRVARDGEQVELAPEAFERIRETRALVERVVARGDEVYGMTTGVGARKKVRVPPDEIPEFNRRLIENHRVATGADAPEDVVRAQMVRIANAFATGTAGVRPEIAERLPKTGTRLNRLVDLSGKTDLPSLAGVLSRARSVVSNDSGAMHLAGAVGARVVALFGATDERRTSPLTSGEASPVPAIFTHDVFCRPCMLRECPIDHRCMKGITPERVFDTLTRLTSADAPSGVPGS